MKKILFVLVFLVSTVLAKENVMTRVLNDVLIQNSKTALDTALKLSNDLNDKKDVTILRQDFKKLVVAWKKVETFYLAGELNMDSLDTPRYIDIFHNIKEDLHSQMKRVLSSKESVKVEMYKNSFKTINALEYVLFAKKFNKRSYEVSKIIVNNLLNRLDEIYEVYKTDTKRFLKDDKWANSLIINMLIESSFKLRDWRIGDIAGLSKKYKNKPSNKRAEYYVSQTSKEAIRAILELHKNLLGSNYGAYLIKKGANFETKLIQKLISASLSDLQYLKNENFNNKGIEKLYKSVDKLHKLYYVTLVRSLKITPKILDADGD